MKTLRLLRNIAVLFILVMALFASRPGVRALRADVVRGCVLIKPGFNCISVGRGECQTNQCRPGQSCTNTACGKVF